MRKAIALLAFFYCLSSYSQEVDSLIDLRDGEVYKTVRIGEQWWMAQNLGYAGVEESFSYDDNPGNCKPNGRLYSFVVAKTACPEGWRLPLESDMRGLLGFAISKHPNAFSGFSAKENIGFNPTPAGRRTEDGIYTNLGITSFYWAVEDGTGEPKRLMISYRQRKADIDYAYGLGYISVRCVKGK
jgi:uncharacterized protein (TIGR02145 family)